MTANDNKVQRLQMLQVAAGLQHRSCTSSRQQHKVPNLLQEHNT
jgi:hypothetical protein